MKVTSLLCVLFCFAVASTLAFVDTNDEKLVAELIKEYNIKETVDLTDIDSSTAMFKQFYSNFLDRKAARSVVAQQQVAKLSRNENDAAYKWWYNSTLSTGYCYWAATDNIAHCSKSDGEDIQNKVNSWFDAADVSNQCLTKVLQLSCAECELQANTANYYTEETPFLTFPVTPCVDYCNDFYTACQSQLLRNGTKFITAGSAAEFCAAANTTNCYSGGSNPKWGAGICSLNSTRAGLAPVKPAEKDQICGFDTGCCDNDELALLTISIGIIVSPSDNKKCYNQLVSSACTVCDPNSGNWMSPINGEPKECQSTCQKRVDACAGVTTNSGATTNCKDVSKFPNSNDDKVCYTGAPIPNSAVSYFASMLFVVVLSVFAVL